MEPGDLFLRVTIWAALTAYVAGEVMSRGGGSAFRWRRWFNTAGCVAFAGHVLTAFATHYDWSHSRAYDETARQTRELTGWESGDGLFVNYVFGGVWLLEAGWMWIRPAAYLARSAGLTHAVRGFFLFMMLNGAVVFAHGPARWYGGVLCVTVAWAWWGPRRNTADTTADSG